MDERETEDQAVQNMAFREHTDSSKHAQERLAHLMDIDTRHEAAQDLRIDANKQLSALILLDQTFMKMEMMLHRNTLETENKLRAGNKDIIRRVFQEIPNHHVSLPRQEQG